MNVFIFLCLIAVSLATPIISAPNTEWHQFKLKHNKTYGTLEEELARIQNFYENLRKIEQHNKLYQQGLVSYKMGVNRFADWTHEEFVSYLKKSKRDYRQSLGVSTRILSVADLPSAVDWRKQGAVTPVKDQRACGSCWAFSTTGALEAHNAIKNGTLVSLSEQELIDCSRNGNQGCHGGLMDNAFDYVKTNGLTTEEAYPYEQIDNRCRRHGKPEAVRVTGYNDIPYGSEYDLQTTVATVGPVSVAVDATYWSYYAGGIYTGKCRSTFASLNHGVLVVGYGTNDDGIDYWIIKNSWGTNWGEDGYIKIARHQNKCGVASEASFPVL